MRFVQITEQEELKFCIPIKNKLSVKAQHAIDIFQHAAWTIGSLEKAFRKNDELAQEINEVFEEVRQFLKQKYGNTIILYRGLATNSAYEKEKDRVLYSWTSDPKIAKIFAGQARKKDKGSVETKYKSISDEEINKALGNFKKRGFVNFYNKYYKLNSNDPTYTDMYDRNREYITDLDTDDLENHFKEIQSDLEEKAKKLKNRGKVIQKEIPIDDIVWITNDHDCKEFIVKNHSG